MPIVERELLSVIESELGSIDALDGFAPRTGRPAAYAAPAGSVCVISSRTTIGVALIPAVFALCAKCDVLVKDREDALVQAFFTTLSEELDQFAAAARASVWHGGSEATVDTKEFNVVVAFGSDQTLQQIARNVRADTRFIGYGSRASVGYISREALRDELGARDIVAGAARDVVLYESEGCLSLHVLFVERDGAVTPERFCELFAGALEQAGVEFPPGVIGPDTSARIAAHRGLAAFRAASGSGTVYGNAHTDYFITLNPPRNEPPAFIPRTLGVFTVEGPRDALEYLSTHHLALEGFALADQRADIVQMAISSGAVRLARFGELQQPPLTGDHGGHPRISEFIRWINASLD